MIDIKKKIRPGDRKNALEKGNWQGYRGGKTYGGSTVVNSEELLTVTGYRLPATDEPRSLRVVMAA